ncbi:MAG TPA: glycosyltransferase family 39 protein, partial [Streptosporangiaceae bacterium]|nr:glycosyltransferase family 39 protein [Streptosporangiaceae bacterium]
MSSARAGHPGTTSSGPEPGGRPAAEESPPAPQAGSAPARTWSGLAVRYAPLIAAAAAMTVAGLWGLTRDSAMGNDEVVSRWAALLSLRQLAHLLRHVDAVHGLYYLLLHGWMVAGTSPTVMRVPSVIAMTAGAVLVAVIGRRLTGSGWAGLFAGLIMALTPSITYYAQTARSYALVFACVMGLTLILLRALAAERSGRPAMRWWVAYGALLTVSSYLNEMAVLVLAAHAITVLLARYGRRAVQHWAIASVAGAVPLAPLLLLSIHQHRALGVIPRPGLHDLWVLYHDYFGATIAAPILLVACAVIAVLPPGTWWRRQRRAGRPEGAGQPLGTGADHGGLPGTTAEAGQPPGAAADPGWPLGTTTEAGQPLSGLAVPWWRGGVSLPSVAVPLLLVPAALLILESLAGPPLYIDRYVLYGEAGVALLAGGGLYRIGQWLAARLGPGRAAARRTLVWVPAAAVLVCTLFLQLTPL